MRNVMQEKAGLKDLAERYGIRLIVQFGSSVTGTVHPQSDLDLGVLVTHDDPPLRTLAEIRQGLQELFPDQDVDLAIMNRADPLFLKKIMEHCRLLYGDPHDLHRLRLYAFKRYQDHRRFLELERRYVERRLAQHRLALSPAEGPAHD
ncbi:MAG: nucleotidyltransferase domain-containing protein [Nitrospirae bacterium]|nr:nucleotidyltransferase domain-containing protein [Nitrospirota bacterium]